MKAKNSREVTRGYLLFTVAMCCSILTGAACMGAFIQTAEREVVRMDIRSQQYDASFARQINLTEKVDSLYYNLTLLNSNNRVNEVVLQNRISSQKMSLISTLDQLESGEALLYGKMSAQVNTVLQVKDSIRLLNSQVDMVKGDLQRCIQDNRAEARKMIFSHTGN